MIYNLPSSIMQSWKARTVYTKVNEGTSMVSKSWHSLNVRQQQVQRMVKMQELV